ncbi:MarR family transcriptional regulator [Labedella populi]|uniref:MarR family transcriptional regulator n=1 Tax=Labedella populi TaxID=2498850 RepID=A0A3S4AGJ1_9MICO|nr:MarR family transcriptional regulator [Labedella populi]RWZ59343.1 MarR family transcriptional regulator [Labedella populi]
MRRFADDDIWIEVTQNEYDVLYTLSKAPDGLSMVEVNRGILMSQGGVSRLVQRLVGRGLIERCTDARDRRASSLRLTREGAELQRTVGRRHARSVAEAMQRALDTEDLRLIRELGRRIVASEGNSRTPSSQAPVKREEELT